MSDCDVEKMEELMAREETFDDFIEKLFDEIHELESKYFLVNYTQNSFNTTRKKVIGILSNRLENRVMPKIAEELFKYLDGVIETRKNGYTNNYREMLMKEAHLEAFENVKGWLINKLH